MQVIEVVTAITPSKNVYLIFVAVGRVHIARSWRITSELIIKPFKLSQVQYMHIIRCKWSLTEPPTYYVKLVSD